MKTVLLLWALLAGATVVLGAETAPPASGSAGRRTVPFTRPPSMFDATTRAQVLHALTVSNRDELLAKLVQSQTVDGETWYDFRGINVRGGDLIGRESNLSHICWDGCHFEAVDLDRADFGGALLRNATFDHTNLEHAVLDDAQIQGAVFRDCQLSDASALRAFCSAGTKFIQCVSDGARFDDAQEMRGVEFSGGSLKGATFRQAKLEEAKFVNMDLTDADFSSADLTGVQFYNSVINGVNFTAAILVQCKLGKVKLSSYLRLVRTVLAATEFGDIDLSKVDVAYAVWKDGDYRISEELEADRLLATDHSQGTVLEAMEKYTRAEKIYQTLAKHYKAAGYLQDYLGLHVRAMEARRKALALNGAGLATGESGLLFLYRVIDNYDTSPGQFFANVLLTLVAFATIFFFALRHRARWFVWYATQPDGVEFASDDKGDFREVSPVPQEQIGATTIWGRLRTHARFWFMGFELSIEAFFRFIENIVDIPDMARLWMHDQDTRPLPKAWVARIIIGIEAMCGIVFLYFGSRMVLMMASSL